MPRRALPSHNCALCVTIVVLLRLIIVSNHLPLRVKRGATDWEFEWDEDALVAQAKVRGRAVWCGVGALALGLARS